MYLIESLPTEILGRLITYLTPQESVSNMCQLAIAQDLFRGIFVSPYVSQCTMLCSAVQRGA